MGGGVSQQFKIYIKYPNQSLEQLTVSGETLVRDIKQLIYIGKKMETIASMSQLILIYKGEVLEDEQTLEELQIGFNAVIRLKIEDKPENQKQQKTIIKPGQKKGKGQGQNQQNNQDQPQFGFNTYCVYFQFGFKDNQMLYYSIHDDLLEKEILLSNPKEIAKRLKAEVSKSKMPDDPKKRALIMKQMLEQMNIGEVSIVYP